MLSFYVKYEFGLVIHNVVFLEYYENITSWQQWFQQWLSVACLTKTPAQAMQHKKLLMSIYGKNHIRRPDPCYCVVFLRQVSSLLSNL